MATAMDYVIVNGLENEATYAYTAYDGTCKYNKAKATTGLKSRILVAPNDANAFKAALNVAPLAVAIEADQMAF